MNIANICISHKYSDILEDDSFFHVQVGAANNQTDLSIHRDDQGDNISRKNPNYCELTGLYWFWKNELPNYDVVVLNHYRRLFLNDDEEKLSYQDIEKIFQSYDVFVPYPKHYPVSITQQYQIMHESKDFDILKTILKVKYPAYDVETLWDNNNKGYLYNMFGMKADNFNQAMIFVFDILSEVEKQVDISQYSVQQARIFGFMSERLLSLYVQQNFKKIKHLPISFVDNEEKVHIFKENKGVNDFAYKCQKPFSPLVNKTLKTVMTSRSK